MIFSDFSVIKHTDLGKVFTNYRARLDAIHQVKYRFCEA